MSVDDFQDFQGQRQRELERLEAAAIDDRDREAIRRFLDRMTGELKTSTLAEYCKKMRKAAEHSDVPLVEIDEDSFWTFRSDLSTDPSYNSRGSDPLAETTVHHYCVAVRRLLQFLERDWADELELAHPDPPTVDPDAMLTHEDVAALVDAANKNRDIALIEFLADTGARISMAMSLRVQDIHVEGDRSYYRPNPNATGLKGAEIKPYPIIDAKAALRVYLKYTHPRPDTPDAALFHRVVNPQHPIDDDDDDDGALSSTHTRRLLKDLAEAAGVDKPVNPHSFRHSAISRMYREGYKKTQIQHRVAWDLDTDMWSRYVHVTAEEMNDSIYADAGVIDEERTASTRREECPTCRTVVAPHHDECQVCGEALDPPADVEQLETCEFCGEAIASYREHLPDCEPARGVIEADE